MEYKNSNSKVIIENNKVIFENKNVVNKTLSHLTINLDAIKEFEIFSWKYRSYIIYGLSLICFVSMFQKTWVVNVDNYNSYTIPFAVRAKLTRCNVRRGLVCSINNNYPERYYLTKRQHLYKYLQSINTYLYKKT